MSSEITVTEHLLLQQQRAPQATGHFTALFHDLVLSAKIIARSVNKAGLLDVLGGTGDINVQGENVQKLDDFANRVLFVPDGAFRCVVRHSFRRECGTGTRFGGIPPRGLHAGL